MATGSETYPNDEKLYKSTELDSFPVVELNRLSLSEPPRPGLRPPPVLEPGARLPLWRAKMNLYLTQIPTDKRGPHILSFLDDRLLESLLSVGITASSPTDRIWQELEALFPDYPDQLQARVTFNRRIQRVGETIACYVSDLRALAARAFSDSTQEERERRIFERFTEGVLNEDARRRFITDPPRDLRDAVRLAGAYSVADEIAPKTANQDSYTMAVHNRPPNFGRSFRDMSDWQPAGSSSNWTSNRHAIYQPRGRPSNGNRGGYRWPGHTRRPVRTYANPTMQGSRWTPNPRGRIASEYIIPTVSVMFDCLLPLLFLTISGRGLEALIDTGASCSLIRPEFCEQIQKDTRERRLRAANGTRIKSQGTAEISLRLDNHTIKHRFIVSADIPWPMILGYDFLRQNQCVLDLSKGKLSVAAYTVALNLNTAPTRNSHAAAVEYQPSDNEQRLATWLSSALQHAQAPEADELRVMIRKHAAVFSWDNTPGRTNLVQHRISTGDAPPIKQSPRRVPIHYQQQLQALIDQMLKDGVIQPSKSPWASPIVLVKKKDGSLRLCVDYRRLNDVTRKDSFPLPRIDDTLEALGGARWFTTLDLAAGYWQVEVHPKDRPKTAFVIPTGLYEFQTMPFGLANAPATFQRLMQVVLSGLTPRCCLVYLDDLIVHGRTTQEHLQNLHLVLNRLEEAGLKLRPEKCILLQEQVKFLGHIIDKKGIQSDPSKVQAVREWPTPRTVAELRSFLGLASYYRRFVRNYASIAAPLHTLTEKDRSFNWTPQCQTAFTNLKETLTAAPVLAFPDTSPDANPFILDTDASDTGIGAVLSQKDNNDLERVIAYASRSLSKAERNYCTTRKEMLALVTYVKYFRHLLLGKPFVVRTDHQALKWLKEFHEPEGQVARWQEQLQAYDFECQHRPGKKHQNADALSRRPHRRHGECPSCSEYQVNVIPLIVATSEEWARVQRESSETRIIYERLSQAGIKPTHAEMAGSSWETMCLWSNWQRLRLIDGILYFQFGQNYGLRIVVPQTLVQSVLKKIHSELGHIGQKKMDVAVSQRFWWPQQRRDIINFCVGCEECIRMKSPQIPARAPMQPIVVGYPNSLVGIDIIGPLPETPRQNRYILVIVDHFTKWCEAVPIPSCDAVTTARATFDTWISRWGAPEQIHSDRGSNFESQVFAELCALLGIRKSRTTAYHPQGNGQVERTNRSLKALLKAFTDETSTREWDLAIPHCLLAYRASIHSSTRVSPHRMLTGRELRLPLDLTLPITSNDHLLATDYAIKLRETLLRTHHLARETLHAAQNHQRDYYDRKVHGEPLQPGEMVYLHNPQPPPGVPPKLHKQWSGPFIVEESLSDTTCRIRSLTGEAQPFTTHFNRLKPAAVGKPKGSTTFNNSTNPQFPEPTVQVEVPAEGGTATPQLLVDIEDNVPSPRGEQCSGVRRELTNVNMFLSPFHFSLPDVTDELNEPDTQEREEQKD